MVAEALSPMSCETPGKKLNPFEVARFLRSFVECSREMQEVVLEMTEIITDESSTADERTLAFDAMMEALFPGTAADVLEKYHEDIKSPAAAEAAEALKSESRGFAMRVRDLMGKQDVTQAALAAAAGISQPAVSNILSRGCRPQRRTIAKFAEALKVSPDELWPGFSQPES